MDSMHPMSPRRALFEVFGVTDNEGSYVLIIGLILGGIAALGCLYCRFYDPLKLWCMKKLKKCLERKPRPDGPPPRGPGGPDDREHWYLNRTLAIDRKDREELGPVGGQGGKGLQGGWYGAWNGGFRVDKEQRTAEI